MKLLFDFYIYKFSRTFVVSEKYDFPISEPKSDVLPITPRDNKAKRANHYTIAQFNYFNYTLYYNKTKLRNVKY